MFIINSCSNRERRDIALAVIEHRIHIRREYRMIMVIDHHCRVGPPQESLRERRTIINLHFNFYISLARIKRKSLHTFSTKHSLHFIAPYCLAAISIFLYQEISRQKSRRTVMLRPVKFDSSRNPRSCQSHQCRFHNLVVINKVTFLHLIISHVYTSSQLGKHHHLDVFILDKQRMIFLVCFLI